MASTFPVHPAHQPQPSARQQRNRLNVASDLASRPHDHQPTTSNQSKRTAQQPVFIRFPSRHDVTLRTSCDRIMWVALVAVTRYSFCNCTQGLIVYTTFESTDYAAQGSRQLFNGAKQGQVFGEIARLAEPSKQPSNGFPGAAAAGSPADAYAAAAIQ